jgi:hypothetical protein
LDIIFNNQAAGDIPYASSTSQLSRLGIGSAKQILSVNSAGTAPEWVSSPAVVTALVPDAADGATIGTAALEFSDVYLADASVIYFGADQEVTLTHVHNTGLLLNSTMAIQFNDASQYINAPTNAILDINATDEIELNATLADVNANLDVSGTYTGGGLMTTGGNIVIPNAGNIGSASDTDAIAISSGGVVTMNQIPVFSAGINVSGGTIAGTLATAAQGNVTSLGTLTALTIDNVSINGTTIGHTSDTDLMTLADGVLTVAGEVSMTTLDIGGTNVTTTAAELNLIDGGTSRGTTAIADGDGVLINDAGTMRMTTVETLAAYLDDEITAMPNLVTTGTIGTGTWQADVIASAYLDADTAHLSTTQTFSGAKTFSSTVNVADDQLFSLGSNNDIVFLNRSTSLAYDTELSNVIEGTSDHPGVAANSLIISNITDDGDIMFVTSDAGNSKGYFKMDGSDGTVMVGGDFYSFNAAANLGTTSNGWNSLVLKTGGAIGVTDDTDSIVIASGGGVTFSQAVTADAGVSIDTITIDASEIDQSSGDLKLDVAGDINLDAAGGDVRLQKAGSTYGVLTESSSNLIIKSGTTTAATFSGANVTFAGSIQVATIDYTDGDISMTIADGGDVTFAEDIHFADGHYFYMGNDDDLRMNHSGSNAAMKNFTGVMYFQYDDSGTSRKAISYDQSGNTWLYHADSAVLKAVSGGVEIVGSLEVATIDYTDGDLAMTIADGGGVTFAQAATFDNDITISADSRNIVIPKGYIQLQNDPSAPSAPSAGYVKIYSDALYDGIAIAHSAGTSFLNHQRLVLGAGLAADSLVVFDGNAQDYYIGLDDGTDTLYFGTGSTVGSGGKMTMDGTTVTVRGVRNNTVQPSNGIFKMLDTAGGNGIYMGTFDSTYTYASYIQSAYLSDSPDAPYNLMLQPDGGNVSIGTTADAAHANADNLIVGSGSGHNGITVYAGNDSQGTMYFSDGTSGTAQYAGGINYDHSTNKIGFLSDGLARMFYSGGYSPKLELGIGTEGYDSSIQFNGYVLDVYMAVDDSGDNFKIGTGTTVGSNVVLQMNATDTYSYNDFKPAGDATYNLGSTSYGWATVHIADNGYIAWGDTNHLIDVNTGYMLFKMPTNEDFYWQQGATNAMWLDTSASTLHVGTHDTTNGLIAIAGGASGNDEGGELRLHTSADNDGSYDYWFLDAYQDDMRVGPAGQVNWLFQSGLTYTYQDFVVHGTTPRIIIGDGGAEDTQITFDGNAQDYYMGLDDSGDTWVFGRGSTVGSSVAFYLATDGGFRHSSATTMLDNTGLYWGNAPDYLMAYSSTNTRWYMTTSNSDGSGTDADIIRIEDGQTTIDANTTWDANVFDIYDDAVLLESAISPTKKEYDFGKGVFKRGREALVEVGILKEYEDGWVGYNDQRMAALLAGGIYQTRWKVDELEEEIIELKNKIKVLEGA